MQKDLCLSTFEKKLYWVVLNYYSALRNMLEIKTALDCPTCGNLY